MAQRKIGANVSGGRRPSPRLDVVDSMVVRVIGDEQSARKA